MKTKKLTKEYMEYAEHIETLVLDDKFMNVITPCGYHYEYKNDDRLVLSRDNILDCSDIELEYVLKLAKCIHNVNINGLKYLLSDINKFVNVYSSLFVISPSLRILQTVSELEVLRLKLRKELKKRFKISEE